MKKILFLFLLLTGLAEASSYHWFCGLSAGSKYFWENGTTAGSRYFWEKGTGPGSRYYWESGDGPGSKYFWSSGTQMGSQYFYQRGSGPGSAYYWRQGGREGSFYHWHRSATASIDGIYIPLCLAGVMVSPVCEPLLEASRVRNAPYDCGVQLQHRLNSLLQSVTRPAQLDCLDFNGVSEQ